MCDPRHGARLETLNNTGIWKRLLPNEKHAPVSDLLQSVLHRPLLDLFKRRGKRIRAQLVELGYLLSLCKGENPASPNQLSGCAEMLEALHAGSLVIDDIQDGSELRRGEPSLHSRYGIPVALNAGNWLYFWPLELLRELGLSPLLENRIYRQYHKLLLRAHLGQAIDVGIAIDTISREKIYDVCFSSLEMKSGSLTALAITLGALLAGASEEELIRMEQFGSQFGVGLQLFDDIGNFQGLRDPSKRWEDLRLKRPSFIWACASRGLNDENYHSFVEAVRSLPELTLLESWIKTHSGFLSYCQERAVSYLENAPQCIQELLSEKPEAEEKLNSLKEVLISSYV